MTVSCARRLPACGVVGDAARGAGPWPGPSPSPGPRRSCRPSRSTASGRGGSPRGRGRRPPSGRPARRSTGTGAGRRPGPGGPPAASARVRPLTSFMVKNGRRSAKVAQLVDRHDAGVLELAADLRLLDEPADQLGRCRGGRSQEDLDGQVAAEVGVAALEDGAHAAAGDLAVDAVADRRVGVAAPSGRTIGPGSSPGPVSRSRTRGTGPMVCGERVQDAGPAGASRWRRSPRRERLRPGPSRPSRSRQRGQSPRGALGPESRRSPGSGRSGPSAGLPRVRSVIVVCLSMIRNRPRGSYTARGTFSRIQRAEGGEQGRGSRPRRRPRSGRPASRRSRSRSDRPIACAEAVQRPPGRPPRSSPARPAIAGVRASRRAAGQRRLEPVEQRGPAGAGVMPRPSRRGPGRAGPGPRRGRRAARASGREPARGGSGPRRRGRRSRRHRPAAAALQGPVAVAAVGQEEARSRPAGTRGSGPCPGRPRPAVALLQEAGEVRPGSGRRPRRASCPLRRTKA